MRLHRQHFPAVLFLILLLSLPAWAQQRDTVTVADYPRHATALTPEQAAFMNRFAAAVVAVLNGGAKVQISTIGHADFDAQGRDFELQVSRERAATAQAELQRLIAQQAAAQAVAPDKLLGLTFMPPTGVGTQQPRFAHPVSEAQRKENRRVELTWVGTQAPPPAPLATQCVKPITGSNPPRSQWAELEHMTLSATVNPVIMQLQPIQEAMGDINTDFYGITFDAQGQSAAQVLLEYRANFNKWISEGSNGASIAPYDATNAAKWNSPNYKGAAMSFVLLALPLAGSQMETAGVIVNCTSPTDWVFTTVTTMKDGLHPVCGNRGFGVLDNHDGTLTIFTKATDRVVNALPYNVAGPTIFAQGEVFWRHFLDNVTRHYATRHPRRIEVSLRRPYF